MADCEDEEVDYVTVPECFCPLSLVNYADLQQTISRSATTTNYGIDLYTTAVEFVEEKLSEIQ